jgi:predicted Zn-dependent peptidase
MDIPVTKTTLKNGIRILTKKLPHTRSVSMGVWVNAGARDESASQSGLSHFIEHMIFKGTRSRSAYQIAKEFDAIGGQTNAFTAMENTCYHAKVMNTHAETMADILSDIFLNSVFDPVEVDRERPVILQEIGMIEDSPDEYVHLRSGYNLWGDHPLGRSILGSPENISGFDAETVKSFFHHLYQPDRILISAAGSIDHDSFLDWIRPAFESIQCGKGLPERQAPRTRSRVESNYRNLEQAHICLVAPGLSITDPRRYAFSLLNTILGGNMSSRLMQEIREKRGLAYSVYSFVSSHVDAGMTGVYLAVDPKQVATATRLVLAEMKKLKENRVAENELTGAVEFTKGNLFLASESTDNQMVRIAQNEIHFGREIPLQEVIEKIERVTVDDIQQMARSIFQEKNMSLTVLGPIREKKELAELLCRD